MQPTYAISKLAPLLLAITLLAPIPAPALDANREPLVVFLVRHAEKELNAGSDPELSREGHQRTALLASMLRDADLDGVHSSDFIRTRDTAASTAAAHELEIALYDPRNLPALVEKLTNSGGRHLVVGHSNTTPNVVALLGGEQGTEIDEANEYDRLYIVAFGATGDPSTALLRYGSPFSSD